MERTKTAYKKYKTKTQKLDVFIKVFYFRDCCSYHRMFWNTTKAEHLLRVYST